MKSLFRSPVEDFLLNEMMEEDNEELYMGALDDLEDIFTDIPTDLKLFGVDEYEVIFDDDKIDLLKSNSVLV